MDRIVRELKENRMGITAGGDARKCSWRGRLRWLAAVAVLWAVAQGAQAASWPQCSVRVNGQPGAPAIVINGTPYSPLMLFLNNQFNRDEVLLKEIHQAADAGVDLLSVNLGLDWYTNSEAAAKVLDTFCEANPSGYWYLRVWLGPNPDWLAAHPDECIAKADGSRLPLASPASAAWRESTAQMLRQCIEEILHGPHAERFIGVAMAYLQTGEWFYPDTNDFMDYSPANVKGFRVWLKQKYRKDEPLQAAWADTEVTLSTALLPAPEQRDQADWGVFRDPQRRRSAMDLQQYQAELVADTIAYFAKVVKQTTRGRSLVGAFYGYTMELNGNGPRALAQSGHLALGTLLECKDIDLIHAPYSYFERKLGDPGHLHLPVDSAALHGKLGLLEEDTFTHLAQEPSGGLIAPGWRERTTTSEETVAIAQRNFGMMFSHGCGEWFCDLLSDGRWSDPKFWAASPLLRRMAAELRGAPAFQPEVAVAVSEESVHALSATTEPLLYESLYAWRSEWDQLGAPVGYYLQRDLPLLPESIKLLILPNAYTVSKDEQRAVRRLLKRGGTVLWCYAPDIAGPDGLDATRISTITGMQVEAKQDDVSRTIASAVTDEVQSFGDKTWQPRFVITSDEGQVLARYQQDQAVSAAAVPLGGGVSIYTATPRLPVGLLRWVCERSGVHLYRGTPGMTGVVGKYLVVHTHEEGLQEFHWPTRCAAIERIVPPSNRPIAVDTNTWQDRLPAQVTAIYRCE